MEDEREHEASWEKDWQETWLPLLLDPAKTDGSLGIEQVKSEMHDLVFIFKQVGEVYDAITGSRLSKPMYYSAGVIEAHNEELEREYNRGFQEGKEEGSA